MKWYWWILLFVVLPAAALAVLYFIGKKNAKNDQLAKAREAKVEKNKYINIDDVDVSELRETVTM